MSSMISYGHIGRFAWNYWKRRPKTGLAAIILMMLAMVADVFTPLYVGKTVDLLATQDPFASGVMAQIIGYFFMFVLLGVSFSLLRGSAMFFWNWFAVGNMYEIVTEAMHKVQRFSADWHANAFAGATVRKVTRGMWAFDVFEDTFFMGLFPAVVMMVIMSIMLMVHVPDVGLFVIASVLVYVVFSVWSAIGLLAPLFRISAAADTKIGATLADIITGNPTVKSFGAEGREDVVFDGAAQSWRKKSLRSWQTANATDVARSLIRSVMMSGMFGMTIWMWSSGRASAGDTAMVLTSYFVLAGYLRDIGMHISNLQRAASELEDVVYFWMREDEVKDQPEAKSLVAATGEIVFDNVGFSYKGQNDPVFSNFSTTIRPGEKVALVGPSGSGKSTFVKLLQRLYDVSEGEILIDGQNIATVTQESLRRAIALVPQDPVLFHRSLTQNIAYGNPEASEAEVIAAASEAYADQFIKVLPLQYETLVGERGVKLSGGERQRVAIARALLARAPILVLDEATSSLDSISEHIIQKALDNLMQGRTTITIAHRLATVRSADRILVFERGRIVEQGSHNELMRRDESHYKKLFDMQALDLVG